MHSHTTRLQPPTPLRSALCATFLAGSVFAQNLLMDADFEQSTPDGSLPDSGHWIAEHIGEAGAACTTTAGRTGNGLWLYTGQPPNHWWSGPHQTLAASPDFSYHASAWIRTPTDEAAWVDGSRARVHVSFHDADGNVLTSRESPPLAQPDPDWALFTVITEAPPAGTAWVRMACLVEKPRGVTGQTVVNFDDCSLQKVQVPAVRVSTRALGVPANLTAASLRIKNPGSAKLDWRIPAPPAWMTPKPDRGSVAPGRDAEVQIRIRRDQLSGTGTVMKSFDLTTNAEDLNIDVYIEHMLPPVPQQPSLVQCAGRQLVVRDRLPDGSLSPPYHYVIRGAAWSPASMDTVDDPVLRRPEFARWYVTDIQLLRAMNANTVYLFMDFGTDDQGMAILDTLYHNGIKAIVTVDENGSANTNRINQVVNAYRNHPAVLAWAIGNEWNINLYHTVHPGSHISEDALRAAAHLTETLAQQVKSLDTLHPVFSIFGDIDVSDGPLAMPNIVNRYCPSVDAWGLNVYRGRTFGPLFVDWARFAHVPVFLSEFGTDAFRTRVFRFEWGRQSVDGTVDEPMQAEFNRGLWREIASNLSAVRLDAVCLGGTVFEWNDEWWKASPAFGGVVGHQDYIGFFTYWNVDAMPDSVANEEWFGIVTIDRRPREVYYALQEEFAAVTVPVNLHHPDAPLHFTLVHASSQGTRLEWSGGIQATQWLERATSLTTDSNWQPIATFPPPVAVTNSFVDGFIPGTGPIFYRVGSAR
jgi:hypothetical protein